MYKTVYEKRDLMSVEDMASVCDTTCLIAVYPISKRANYCPNYGARMDGGEENE